MANDYGYGEVDEVVKKTSSGGKYMKLEKDHKYQFRIASRPRYTIRHWEFNKPYPCTGEACQYCKSNDKDVRKKVAQWYWIVIDREEEELDKSVKILQAPNSVAMRIKEMSELISMKTKKPVWGDPTTFDIVLQKTQVGDGPTKYTVDGDVDSRGEMTEEEKAAVTKANYDLEAEVGNSKVSEHVGNYSTAGKSDMETAPEDGVNPDDIPENLGEGTTGSEEVSDDDIPF